MQKEVQLLHMDFPYQTTSFWDPPPVIARPLIYTGWPAGDAKKNFLMTPVESVSQASDLQCVWYGNSVQSSISKLQHLPEVSFPPGQCAERLRWSSEVTLSLPVKVVSDKMWGSAQLWSKPEEKREIRKLSEYLLSQPPYKIKPLNTRQPWGAPHFHPCFLRQLCHRPLVDQLFPLTMGSAPEFSRIWQ